MGIIILYFPVGLKKKIIKISKDSVYLQVFSPNGLLLGNTTAYKEKETSVTQASGINSWITTCSKFQIPFLTRHKRIVAFKKSLFSAAKLSDVLCKWRLKAGLSSLRHWDIPIQLIKQGAISTPLILLTAVEILSFSWLPLHPCFWNWILQHLHFN